MRRLSGVYPQYAGAVDLYAVSVDVLAETADLERFAQELGPGIPVVDAGARMPADFHIVMQSTKVIFDGGGTIVYRAGYGQGTVDEYRQVMERLAASPGGG